MDLAADIDQFLAQGAAEGRRPQTIVIYRSRLAALLAFLRGRGIARWPDVTPATLQAYCLSLAAAGRKRSSRIGIANTISLLFRSLHAAGRVLRDPSRDLPVPADDLDDLPEAPLSEEQVAALFAQHPRATPVDLRDLLHLEILYGCALRVGESVALDVDDLDVPNRQLHVRDGKGGKPRTVPMFGGVLATLDAYLAVRASLLRGPDHGVLLLSGKGKRVIAANLQAHLRRLARQPWCPVRRLHPHQFRHACAVHLLRGGVDIKHIQMLLGHADIEQTRRYTRIVPGLLAEVYHRHMPEIAVRAAGMGPTSAPP